MNSLNSIYVQHMVDAVRNEIERHAARQAMLADLPKSSFVAKARRVIGASFIGAGRFIQGRPKAKAKGDLDPAALELAR
jgi:hypothetical protein